MASKILLSGLSGLIGLLIGYYWGQKSKSSRNQKLNENSIEKRTQVLFFPDSQTAACQDLTRVEKGQIYKEILNYSRPLKQLEEVLKSAKGT